jgi:hypothetical protein
VCSVCSPLCVLFPSWFELGTTHSEGLTITGSTTLGTWQYNTCVVHDSTMQPSCEAPLTIIVPPQSAPMNCLSPNSIRPRMHYTCVTAFRDALQPNCVFVSVYISSKYFRSVWYVTSGCIPCIVGSSNMVRSCSDALQ